MGHGEGSVDMQLLACVLIFLSSLAAFLVTMSLVSNTSQASALAKELSRMACCYCSSLVRDRLEEGEDDCDNCGVNWIHRCEATVEMSTDRCEEHSALSSSTSRKQSNQSQHYTDLENSSSHLLVMDHHHHHDHPHDTIRELFESNVSTPLVLIRCMAAGIILGVAIMHLMADGQQFLQTQVSLATYPLGLLFLGVGIFITLGIDQIAMSSMANAIANGMKERHGGASDHIEGSGILNGGSKDYSKDHGKTVNNGGGAITEADQKALVKAYILEAGVAVHSVILGFGLGTMRKTTAIEVLLIVLIFHQVLEGIGLGTVMAETCLTARMKIIFAIIFGLTLPVGALFGIAIKQTAGNSPQGDIIEGIMNTLAAGSLVYTSMVEMIASEFQFSVNAQNATGAMKGLMFLSLTGGFGIMSILAIWG